MLEQGLIAFIIASVSSVFISKLLLVNAKKFRFHKKAFAERVKLHGLGVPRLGGLAIFPAFCLALIAAFSFCGQLHTLFSAKLLGILCACLVVVGLGFYDDLIKRLGYKIKFSLQILAVLFLLEAGYEMNIVSNPFGGLVHLDLIGPFIIIVWILLIMNAMNLIDGLDGLATGLALLASVNFLIVAVTHKNLLGLVITASLIGSMLGFLKYNFYPARLFLGDSGSLFIGLMLGVMALETSAKGSAIVSLIIPILTLIMPIGSVIFSFSRRFSNAKDPFKPDRWHLHYRLIKAGLSHRTTVLTFYIVSLIFICLGMMCLVIPKKYELMVFMWAGIIMWVLYMWALNFINSAARKKRFKGGRRATDHAGRK